MLDNKIADRFNDGKTQWSLLDLDTIEGLVKVLEFGTVKYLANNWKKGLSFTSICDSLDRHKQAFLNGENLDKESGLPHVDHMQCNTMFLAYMFKFKPDMDNRMYDANKMLKTIKDYIDPKQLDLFKQEKDEVNY